jgi:hypothetical protein
MASTSDPPPKEDGTYSIVNGSKKKGSDADSSEKAPSLSDLVDLYDPPVGDQASASEEEEPEDPGDEEGAAEQEEGDEAPTLEAVEPLLAKGSYQAICDLLGPLDRAEQLGPELALIYATASKEATSSGAEEDVNPVAIRSVATLLGVSEDSRTALMVAKRILRRNPVVWQKRKAPGAPVRVALIILGLAVGIVGGWLAGPGPVQLQEVIETMMR